MSKVLIFGASGFLGEQVVSHILSLGHEVFAVTRSYRKDQPERFRPEVTWIEADLYDPDQWKAQAAGADTVIDLVGIIREDASKGETYQHVILEAAQVIGSAAKELGIPDFIYVSADVENPAMPQGYVNAKKQAEDYLSQLGFNLQIFRPGMMYGANRLDKIETAQEILAKLDPNSPAWSHRPIEVSHVGAAIAKVIGQAKDSRLYRIDDIEAMAS